VAEAGIDSVSQKQRNLPSESGVLRHRIAELVPGFVPSAAIQAWAALIAPKSHLRDRTALFRLQLSDSLFDREVLFNSPVDAIENFSAFSSCE